MGFLKSSCSCFLPQAFDFVPVRFSLLFAVGGIGTSRRPCVPNRGSIAAPWQSVYKTQLFTDGDLTFVLTKGGHNTGILSEPGHKGRHYRKQARFFGIKIVQDQLFDPTG